MDGEWTAAEIVGRFGGGARLAAALAEVEGLSQQITAKTCQNWMQRDSIPGEYLWPIFQAGRKRRIAGLTQAALLQFAAKKLFQPTQNEEISTNGENIKEAGPGRNEAPAESGGEVGGDGRDGQGGELIE